NLRMRRRTRRSTVLGLALLVTWAHAAAVLWAARPAPLVVGRAPVVEVRTLALPSPVAQAQEPPTRATPSSADAVRKSLSASRPHPTPLARAPATPLPAQPVAVSSSMPLPPTRVPASMELVFALQRGADSGHARLSWQADGDRYALSLQATLPSGRQIEQMSQGGFDAAGVAPLRLADRKNGRDLRAANFQREHGKVTFSGPRWELPLDAGTQDRLSWLVQLVALAHGAQEGLRDGAEMAMWVVGARGAASHWRFEVRGTDRVAFAGQDCETWHLVREPAHPYDTRVEVWLDATSGHWPLKLRQTQIPGGEPLEWLLQQRTASQPGT
ncbi:MAG TPA: DUF3108 domain-containing protein, partial [Burkholderiaceae bacterium]|nr:DUF3108 domain-containing protein [Burkholderiaceae bacterium]